MHAKLLVLGLICSSCIATAALADSSSKSLFTFASTQTYTLSPGMVNYDRWAEWVERKNEARLAQLGPYRSPLAKKDAGLITIILQTPEQNIGRPEQGYASSLSTVGPPVPLPATGTPGQKITITNKTYTQYETWTYQWQGTGASSGGGWGQVNYENHICVPDRQDVGRLCARSV